VDNFENLAQFIGFTHAVQQVKRAMFAVGEEQFENDAEHSFQIALTALYIIETNGLKLDAFRVMALALVHDILEVHSGDTPVYGAAETLATKADREAAAVAKLKSDWPKLTLMHELIEECEAKVTPESKFVYALDKLVPIFNNYLDKGRSWHRNEVTLEHLMAVKAGKIDRDPTIKQYYEQVLVFLREHPEFLPHRTVEKTR
jgi:5'-deoxynucleotidase YfbR-like HD superfamily hydrolase